MSVPVPPGGEVSLRATTRANGHGGSGSTAANGAILNKHSREVTQGADKGGAQAMLHGAGLTVEDLDKAQVGISSVWWEGNPCNTHLLDFAKLVKEGCKAAGLVGLQYNTIGISDAITMGSQGMRFSLPSRDLIADSIESVTIGQCHDANVSVVGCDKNPPGALMAAMRHNRPTIVVWGGTIMPGYLSGDIPGLGRKKGDKTQISDTFEAAGAYITGKITNEERLDIVRNACPGPGACGGLYTANTMASFLEVTGMCLPGTAATPAIHTNKRQECLRVGHAIRNLLELDIKPRDILTKKAFENAIVLINVLGGSTNAVLHLLAIARCGDVELEIDDFQRIADKVSERGGGGAGPAKDKRMTASDDSLRRGNLVLTLNAPPFIISPLHSQTPFLANMKPSGKYLMEDLFRQGGLLPLIKYLANAGLLHLDTLTCTGRTLGENLADVEPMVFDGSQDIIAPLERPLKPTGHLTIMRGNLCPGGAVSKLTGKEGLFFEGTAVTFDQEEGVMEAISEGRVKNGCVIIIRYVGPKGAPGESRRRKTLVKAACIDGSAHNLVSALQIRHAGDAGANGCCHGRWLRQLDCADQ